MKRVIFVVCYFFFLGISAQPKYEKSSVSKKVRKIANQIKSAKTVEGKFIGKGASPSVVYAKFKKLIELASSEELLELTNHNSPVVRTYAFWGYVQKGYETPFFILEKNKEDRELVKRQFGCIISRTNVIDLMISLYQIENREILTEKELEYLNSLKMR